MKLGCVCGDAKGLGNLPIAEAERHLRKHLSLSGSQGLKGQTRVLAVNGAGKSKGFGCEPRGACDQTCCGSLRRCCNHGYRSVTGQDGEALSQQVAYMTVFLVREEDDRWTFSAFFVIAQ